MKIGELIEKYNVIAMVKEFAKLLLKLGH